MQLHVTRSSKLQYCAHHPVPLCNYLGASSSNTTMVLCTTRHVTVMQTQGEAMQLLLSDACQQQRKPTIALVGATIQPGLSDTATSMVCCDILTSLACSVLRVLKVGEKEKKVAWTNSCKMALYVGCVDPITKTNMLLDQRPAGSNCLAQVICCLGCVVHSFLCITVCKYHHLLAAAVCILLL